MVKLNSTPIRTARNYQINNIEIKDLKIPEKIGSFNNVEIKNESSKIDVSNEVSDFDLTYGVDKNLEAQVKTNANQKYKIVIDNKTIKNFEIDFKFDKEDAQLVDNIEIIAKQGAKANIIIKYMPNGCRPKCKKNKERDCSKCYHNGVIRTLVEKSASVNIVLVNFLNDESDNLVSIENELEENSKLKYTIVDFGGKSSVTNYYSNIKGDNSSNTLNTMYLGNNNQIFDLNYITHLRGKNTNFDMEVQGALKDKAKKNFKGTIDFKRGCKKAQGSENENCMLLSNEAKSISLPILLCTEEEVDGAHSASSGKVGEKELFYIMSRGFEYKEAMKLLVKANFNKIIQNINDEFLKNQILKEIEERLD